MRRTVMGLVLVTGVALGASGVAFAQGSTSPQVPALTPNAGVPQAPVGHRQPMANDVPPLPAHSIATPSQPATQQSTPSTTQQEPARPARATSREMRTHMRAGSYGGGPPVLQVGPSCEAAGRGAVVLGRNKEACLADETTAQDTLKQNWQKYASNDKTSCIGMTSTGGPASYVELLSCLEIMRDARNIQNADPLESDNSLGGNSSRRTRRR